MIIIILVVVVVILILIPNNIFLLVLVAPRRIVGGGVLVLVVVVVKTCLFDRTISILPHTSIASSMVILLYNPIIVLKFSIACYCYNIDPITIAKIETAI